MFSPHWALDERARTTEQKSTKRVKTLLYQEKMVQKMDALLVTTEQERQGILRLGWTKRIDIVQDSILNSSLSDDEMALQTISFYRKVLDTRYQFAMTAMEKAAIPSLLHAGLAQETIHNLLPSDQLLNLRSLVSAVYNSMHPLLTPLPYSVFHCCHRRKQHQLTRRS